ncbi:MAG TPA: gamma-glutamyl-gamma-aminobutyrate hydrolase family protein [Dissulfurispiraceae bacterium]|nr:gamma-glutamyl-gamma-aminobutyrate hydrolase family protein [Dissulfurispiraceae bacterium]
MRPLIGITADMASTKKLKIGEEWRDERFFRLKGDYVSAVVRAGGVPLVLVPAFEDIPGIAELVDGLMVPGGGDIPPEYYNETAMVPPACFEFAERDRTDFELALLQEINKKQKPVLGICYGMQLINVMLGGSLYQDIGHQRGGGSAHKEGRHGIRITGHFPAGLQPQSLIINSNHHQAVKTLGRGLEVFAEAEDSIIEGVYCTQHPFLAGVQWHPEQECDTLSFKILALFIEKAKACREQSAYFSAKL